MIKEIYKQIIFTDNVRKLKKELKNKNNNIIIKSISYDSVGVDNILQCNGFNIDRSNANVSFIDAINSSKNTKYDYVYIHIKDVNNILSYIGYYCHRLNFFNILNSITNKQIYFIIDIKYKDYVFNQIEEYNKHINRLRSFGEIHNQVIFVDDIEKVKQNINTETEMFNETDGNKCRDTRSFYDKLVDIWKFPDCCGWISADAFKDYVNDYDWDDPISSFTIIFNYIKDINNIILDNERGRSCIFKILYTIYNKKVFILIDKKDKDYFLEQAKIWEEKYRYKHK